ncbi:hypothetical protein [Marivirga sp.]|uniref:hypothetical protein n=1 Tax=Marivirga sp. TaxID=2018662 RepID=UPI003DA6DCFB
MKDQLLFRTKHRGLMLLIGIIMASCSIGLQLSTEMGIFNQKHKKELFRRFGLRKTSRKSRKEENFNE